MYIPTQSALKYLKDTEVDLNNILLMTGDFNIRDCLWDPSFLFHSSFRDILFNIADSFHLELSKPTENFPTRYSDNDQDSNSVLDLVFLCPKLTEFNSHHIHPDWRLSSDHAPITTNIFIVEEQVQVSKYILIKNSEEEDQFIAELKIFIKNLKTDSIVNINVLEEIINFLAININYIWHKHSKKVNITRHSKVWWDNNCHRDLDAYQHLRSLDNWKKFRRTVKKTKQKFFDDKIDEIANRRCSPWELIN